MRLRHTILCLAVILSCVTYGSDSAYGQSPALLEAQNRYKTLHQQGKYSEADSYAEKALKLSEEEFGPDHTTTAGILDDLALLYQAQGYLGRDIIPLFQRSLAIREKALGPEHPDVAMSLNNLALAHYNYGSRTHGLFQTRLSWAEAAPLYRRLLAIQEKALGLAHPDLAMSLANLAKLYSFLGNDAEAAPLYRRLLAIQEKALGPEHPNVATSLENYSGHLWRTGRKEESREMADRAKAIRAKNK